MSPLLRSTTSLGIGHGILSATLVLDTRANAENSTPITTDAGVPSGRHGGATK